MSELATTGVVSMHLIVYDDEVKTVELHLPADVDVRNRQAIKLGVIDHLANGSRAFVIDFRSCHYVDTSALGALLSVRNKILAADGTLRLRGVNAELRELMRVTDLESLFTFTYSADA